MRNENQGMKCIKYLLFTFNFIMVLTGILVIMIGTLVATTFSENVRFLENRFVSPAILMIIIGFIIFLVAFFGCCGAIKESTCMIMMFAVFLGFIFILELSAGIAAYVLQDQIQDELITGINNSMHNYMNSEEDKDRMDFVQTKIHCCGLDGPDDWKGLFHLDMAPYSDSNISPVLVPDSCCIDLPPDQTPKQEFCPVSSIGCRIRLQVLMNELTFTLASAALTIALMQLLGVAFACSLGKSIRAHKTERELRRWQLRESLVDAYKHYPAYMPPQFQNENKVDPEKFSIY